MISEGPCGTENWSNDGDNSALTKIYSNRKVPLNHNNILTVFLFFFLYF